MPPLLLLVVSLLLACSPSVVASIYTHQPSSSPIHTPEVAPTYRAISSDLMPPLLLLVVSLLLACSPSVVASIYTHQPSSSPIHTPEVAPTYRDISSG